MTPHVRVPVPWVRSRGVRQCGPRAPRTPIAEALLGPVLARWERCNRGRLCARRPDESTRPSLPPRLCSPRVLRVRDCRSRAASRAGGGGRKRSPS